MDGPGMDIIRIHPVALKDLTVWLRAFSTTYMKYQSPPKSSSGGSFADYELKIYYKVIY